MSKQIIIIIALWLGNLVYAQAPSPKDHIRIQNAVKDYCRALTNYIRTGDVNDQIALEDMFDMKQNQVYNDLGFSKYGAKMSFSAYLTEIRAHRQKLNVSYNLPSELATLPLYTFTSPNQMLRNPQMWVVPVQKQVNGTTKQNVFYIGVENFKIYNVYKELPEAAERIYFTKTIRLTSDPTGATVYLNNNYKGTTPLNLELTDGRSYTARLQKTGYQTKTATLTTTRPNHHIILQPNQNSNRTWWNNLNDKWKKVFNEAIGKGKLTTSPTEPELQKILNLTELDCSWNKIRDLSPVQNLNNLTTLSCDSNQIRDLSPVQNLNKLTKLDCSFNQIRNLSPVQNLNKLTTLSCWGNQIIDLSPVQNLNNLTKLDCSFNQIRNLSPVQNLNKLTDLDCRYNQIIDLSPVQKLNKLTDLDCSANQIRDLSPVQNLNKLTYLNCRLNQIRDLSPVQNLNNLTSLGCSENQIRDLSPVQNLNNLTSLFCSDNQIIDLSPVQNLNNLTSLFCSENQISPSQIEYFKKRHPNCEVWH